MTDFTVLDIETTGNQPWRDQLVAVGIGDIVYQPDVGRALARNCLQGDEVLVCHTNYDLRWLCLDGAKLGPEVTFHDTKVMAWMLDGTQELDLASLAAHYLGYVPSKPIVRRQGRIMFQADAGLIPIEDVPWEEMVEYNASDLEVERELYVTLRSLLQQRGLWEQFTMEEAPFSRLLIEMEATGLPFDAGRAQELLYETEYDAEDIRKGLVEQVGATDFNLASGDQVAKFLYHDIWQHPVKFAIPRLVGMTPEQKAAAVKKIAPKGVRVTRIGRDYAYGVVTLDGLGLRPPKVKLKWNEKPKKRPTVSGKLLNVIYGDNPWIAGYVAWKKAEKLNGYLRDWIEREHEGRLHGRFDQSGTITGRLSGREPNLQQVSGESGVRSLFRGDLVVGDYGGLEARIAAHFSGDPVMTDIFTSGKDLYGVLASRAWGGEETRENPGRGLMKTVWLASQYGAQGETLAQTMAVGGHRGYTPKTADALLKDMKNTVPRLFEWREEVIAEALSLGYVTTLAGRRRHLADIGSAVWSENARAERQAVSHKVQGSAADIVRRAMLLARERVLPSVATICLQVHDEILWVRGAGWSDDVFPELVDLCENGTGFDLAVPLVFEAAVTDSWAGKGGGISPSVYDQLNSGLEVA